MHANHRKRRTSFFNGMEEVHIYIYVLKTLSVFLHIEVVVYEVRVGAKIAKMLDVI